MPAASAILIERPHPAAATAKLRAGGVSELLANLYASRGVTDIAEVGGRYEDLLPVDTLKNVRAMASYLADCVVKQKRVLIISDYDCDGATACALLLMAFGACGMSHGYLVPDREKHGYGLTTSIVDDAAALEFKPEVIITVDNGISSIEGVARAKALGIEVLITDHHLAPATLPDARLIVNPNQLGCDFASKNIAGCGVAWYVARALVEELTDRNMDPGFDPAELLCYVAVGTVADIVKLDVNNRIMIAQGLEHIRRGQCPPGIPALARVSMKNPATLACVDIGFGIGPRINAAGRLAHMSVGIECLTTLDDIEAARLAVELQETNEERKEIQKGIVDEALIQAVRLLSRDVGIGSGVGFGKRCATPDDEFGRRSIVVFHEDWHEGVIGVVAGRLKEDRHRPTIVMTQVEKGIKGSGRSIPGFHLKHALDEIAAAHPGILISFGGHAMAAGCTIQHGRLDEFRDALELICQRELTPAMLTKTLAHDGALSQRHFDIETIRDLSQQVWGQGFEEPVFVNEIEVTEVKVLKEVHLKMTARLGETEVSALHFFQGDLASGVAPKMTVAHKPGINTFCGEDSLQLMVELMPENMNPTLSAPLRAREALLSETASSAEDKGHIASLGPSANVAPAARPALSVISVRAGLITPSKAEVRDEIVQELPVVARAAVAMIAPAVAGIASLDIDADSHAPPRPGQRMVARRRMSA